MFRKIYNKLFHKYRLIEIKWGDYEMYMIQKRFIFFWIDWLNYPCDNYDATLQLLEETIEDYKPTSKRVLLEKQGGIK